MDHDTRMDIAYDFSREVRSRFGDHVTDIILFGSLPRWEDEEDSDIDILVIVNDDDTSLQRDLSFLSFDFGMKYGEFISVQTVTRKHMDEFSTFSFFQNVLKEGITIG